MGFHTEPVFVTLGVLVLAIVFGIVGYLSERTITWRGQRYEIDVLGRPHRVEAAAPKAH